MNIIKLFFCVTFFIALKICGVLYAQGGDAAELLDGQDGSNDEMVLVVAKICDLLQQGRTAEEVLTVLGNDNSCEMQKLVKQVQDTLMFGKQKSRDSVINIVVHNKEADKFYARKNFWSNVKNVYATLKIIIILVVVYIVYYYVSKLLNIKIPFPWFSRSQRSRTEKFKQDATVDAALDAQGHLTSDNAPSQQAQGNQSQSPSGTQLADGAQTSDDGSDCCEQGSRLAEDFAGSGQDADEQFASCDNPLESTILPVGYNHKLYDKIAQQVEELKRSGLEPFDAQLGDFKSAVQFYFKDIEEPLKALNKMPQSQQFDIAADAGMLPALSHADQCKQTVLIDKLLLKMSKENRVEWFKRCGLLSAE